MGAVTGIVPFHGTLQMQLQIDTGLQCLMGSF
jgi:hypothetical protein